MIVKNNTIPNIFDKDEALQKQFKQYWVGYTCDKKGKILLTLLHSNWIRDAYFTDDEDNDINVFTKGFIYNCMIVKKFVSSIISRTKK